MVDAFKPDYIAPIVGYLTSEANEETSGCLFEIMGGWAAANRYTVFTQLTKSYTMDGILVKEGNTSQRTYESRV